jgi:hypothetical protein
MERKGLYCALCTLQKGIWYEDGLIYLSQHDIKANKINVLFHDYILNSTTECHD